MPGFCGVLGFFCFSKHANVIPMKIRFGDCWVPLFVRVLKINGKACAPRGRDKDRDRECVAGMIDSR